MRSYTLPPLLRKLRRGPAVVLPKDIGTIVAETGIGKESTVVDGGTGSGFLCIALANIVKQVTTYEIDERFVQLARENILRSGFSNIVLKQKDLRQGIDERDVDLVTLDLLHAEEVVPHAFASLKPGGFVVGYCPNTEQVRAFYTACVHAGFQEPFVIETWQRRMLVKPFGIRPEHHALVHTAYLVFAQKRS